MIYTPGRYTMPSEQYHADPCMEPSLSRGVIKDLIYHTPAHVKQNHPRLNPDWAEDEDPKFNAGKAAHALLLEGVDSMCICPYPDWRTTAAKEAREAARDAGKTPMLTDQYESILTMVEAAKSQLAQSELGITDLHVQGSSEVTYIWYEDGVWCRARLDWISEDRTIILDPKFTGNSASPGAFDRLIEPMGYDIQMAWYSWAVEKVEGVKPKRFVFWVTEDAPPYLSCPISLNPEYLNMGVEKVNAGIRLWKKLLSDNQWPGYPTRICYLEPKPWALASWEERRFALELNSKEEVL